MEGPAGNVPFLLGHATGTQSYACQPSSTCYAWTLVAPSATLVNDKGKQIVTHFVGPAWQAKDGSTVVGARIGPARVVGPAEGARSYHSVEPAVPASLRLICTSEHGVTHSALSD
jgi:hypothetical protein